MSLFSDIRAGLAANLSAIDGLRTYDFIPDEIAPPVALVTPRGMQFDKTYGRAADDVTFEVSVVVRRTSARTGQDQLDDYCDSTGTLSVKTAIEADTTLGGTVMDLRVTEISNYSAVDIGETTYLQATFVVSIIA